MGAHPCDPYRRVDGAAAIAGDREEIAVVDSEFRDNALRVGGVDPRDHGPQRSTLDVQRHADHSHPDDSDSVYLPWRHDLQNAPNDFTQRLPRRLRPPDIHFGPIEANGLIRRTNAVTRQHVPGLVEHCRLEAGRADIDS